MTSLTVTWRLSTRHLIRRRCRLWVRAPVRNFLARSSATVRCFFWLARVRHHCGSADVRRGDWWLMSARVYLQPIRLINQKWTKTPSGFPDTEIAALTRTSTAPWRLVEGILNIYSKSVDLGLRRRPRFTCEHFYGVCAVLNWENFWLCQNC